MSRNTRSYVTLFTVGGVPVHAHWSIAMGGLIVSRFNHAGAWQTLWLCLAYVVLIFVHEAGHAVAARLSGARVLGIWMGSLGGRCDVIDLHPTNRSTLAIYSAGVVAQMLLFLLALAYLAVAGWPHDVFVESLVATFTFVNLVLIVVTLIPHVSATQASDGYVLMKLAQHVILGTRQPFANPGGTAHVESGPVFTPGTRLRELPAFAASNFSVGVEILNDSTTPMDFVVVMLMRHLSMTREDAMRSMLDIHLTGGQLVPLATIADAERAAAAITSDAVTHGFAFVCRAVDARA
jgi:ATP-dependent Clp protease adapter protein ClpS